MIRPLPPARVSAMAPTRHSRASTPVYSARPPATPPITLSERLRRSCGRGTGPVGGGGGGEPHGWSPTGGGAEGGSAEVMAPACPPEPPGGIRERPGSPLILRPRRSGPAHDEDRGRTPRWRPPPVLGEC